MSLKCKIGFHNWMGCKCSACGKIRDDEHNWSQDCEKCSKCGKTQQNKHNWNKCQCKKCGQSREESHDWQGLICSVCGRTKKCNIKNILPTGNQFLDSCFRIEFENQTETRIWSRLPDAKDLAAKCNDAMDSGYYQSVLYELDNFILKYPTYHFAYCWYAHIYSDQGNHKDAIRILMEGLKKVKEKARICAVLGDKEFEAGNFREAIKWWIKSSIAYFIQNDYQDYEHLYYLSYITGYLGDTKSSSLLNNLARLYGRGKEITPKKALYFRNAMDFHDNSDVVKALEIFAKEYLNQ
jgi:tetratricopeptide (TPR) repeat protein